MAAERISISSQHRLKSGEYVRWAKSVPVTAFTFHEEGGVKFALVGRTYYLDQKTNKIRYQEQKFATSMYVLIDRGVYAYAGVYINDEGSEKKLKEKAKVRRRLGSSTVADFMKELRWFE